MQFRKSCVIAYGNLLNWKKDSRIWMTFILISVLLFRYFIGLTAYGIQKQTTITPFLLPVLFADAAISNGLLKVQLYLGLICLLCDAPFLNERFPYQLIRSGRRAWWMSGCIYIWCASFLYLIFLMLGAFLAVLPTASFSELWGTTIPALLKEDCSTQILYFGSMELPQELMQMIYPHGAQIMTFFAGWLSFSFLGHMVYMINLCSGQRLAGIALAVFLVMLDPVVRYLGYGLKYRWMYLVSPVSWSSIENWTILGYGHPVSPGYAYGMYAVGIAVFAAAIAAVSKRKMITVEGMELPV